MSGNILSNNYNWCNIVTIAVIFSNCKYPNISSNNADIQDVTIQKILVQYYFDIWVTANKM